jgi:hypothetical protein
MDRECWGREVAVEDAGKADVLLGLRLRADCNLKTKLYNAEPRRGYQEVGGWNCGN